MKQVNKGPNGGGSYRNADVVLVQPGDPGAVATSGAGEIMQKVLNPPPDPHEGRIAPRPTKPQTQGKGAGHAS